MGLCQLGKRLLGLVSAGKMGNYRLIIASDRLYISRNIVNNSVQCKNDRHLDQKRKTAARHGCAVFLIYCLDLSLHHHRGFLIIFFSFVFLLNCCNFRLHNRHQLGWFLLLYGQGNHKNLCNQCKQDNAKADIFNAEYAGELKKQVHDPAKDTCDRPQKTAVLCQYYCAD